MTVPPNKQQRKALRTKYKQDEEARKAPVPLSPDDFRALCDFVDSALNAEQCDHTLKHSRIFLEARSLPTENIVNWLRERGGYCDCEVHANVENE